MAPVFELYFKKHQHRSLIDYIDIEKRIIYKTTLRNIVRLFEHFLLTFFKVNNFTI